ncbi:MAG: immune inhibitor A [Anaerolineae bacterium]|nr:immune inhibitor A [Anaerolineae bacterium]
MRRLLIAFLLLFAVSGLPVHAEDDRAAETLALLSATTLPQRDRFALARWYLGVRDLPERRAEPIVYRVGDTKVFETYNLDTETRLSFTARLALVSQHAYWWFEEGYTPDMTALRRSAERFDQVIYPTVRAHFGSEDSPGIDADPRLFIVHARNLGKYVAAYFSSTNEFPRAIVPESNEHQMFWVNLDTMRIGTAGYEGTLAHEFQHMIHHAVDSNESLWLNEGMSELAADLSGYRSDANSFARAFLRNPQIQLNAWSVIEDSAPHYGAAYLFMRCFLHRFGVDTLRALAANPSNGMASLTETLAAFKHADENGAPITAEVFFADWVAENWLNNGCPTPLSQAPRSELIELGENRLTLPQFGTRYLRLPATGNYTLTVQSEPTVRVIPTDAHSGAYFWWSNRGDDSHTRLTRAFDLRGVERATFTFRLWHNIEENWDYAYLSVSEDNGETWRAVETSASRPAGGNHNPYGPAFTGKSGDGESPRWIAVTADLSAYAGKQILLRFDYIMDDAIDFEGMALDDLALPEIGYFYDAEVGDGGWRAEGFVRMANQLPTRTLVQVLASGKVQARHILERDETLRLDVKGDAVIALSGLREFTTERSSVTYSLAPSTGRP